jgi:hypothetical protein
VISFLPLLAVHCSTAGLGALECQPSAAWPLTAALLGIVASLTLEAKALRKAGYRHAIAIPVASLTVAAIAGIWATRPLFNADLPHAQLVLLLGIQVIGVPAMMTILLMLSAR